MHKDLVTIRITINITKNVYKIKNTMNKHVLCTLNIRKELCIAVKNQSTISRHSKLWFITNGIRIPQYKFNREYTFLRIVSYLITHLIPLVVECSCIPCFGFQSILVLKANSKTINSPFYEYEVFS